MRSRIPDSSRKVFCYDCQIFRWAGVEHCFDCGVCIDDLDHHCPWSSKCIGGDNKKPFYAFVLTTLTYIVYILVTIIVSAGQIEETKTQQQPAT
jgi:DHHC palmitoyltransferase